MSPNSFNPMFLVTVITVNAGCGNTFTDSSTVLRVADVLSTLPALEGLATIIGLAYRLGDKFREIDLRF